MARRSHSFRPHLFSQRCFTIFSIWISSKMLTNYCSLASADSCIAFKRNLTTSLQSRIRDTTQASRGKHYRLRHTPAGFTALDLDGYGLRDHSPACPPRTAFYPVSVCQVMALLHASFRPHLTMTPLRYANPSPPSGWVEDSHLQICCACSAHKKRQGHGLTLP